MEKSLAAKIIQYLFAGLFVLSVILGIIFFAINKEPGLLIGWAYTLVGVSVGALLVFALVNMFSSKKAIITSLSILGGFAVLIGISYVLASGFVPSDSAGVVFDITESTSRWSGASLYMLYILMGISFVSLIYTEIRGAFK